MYDYVCILYAFVKFLDEPPVIICLRCQPGQSGRNPFTKSYGKPLPTDLVACLNVSWDSRPMEGVLAWESGVSWCRFGCSIGNRRVSDGHKLLAFASDRSQASVAPHRLTGEGSSRGLGCIDVERVCKNMGFLKEPPTMAKKLHSLPPATGDLITQSEGTFNTILQKQFCTSAWNVLRAYTWGGLWSCLPLV